MKAGIDRTEVLRKAADFNAIRRHPGYSDLITKLTVSKGPSPGAAHPAAEGNTRP